MESKNLTLTIIGIIIGGVLGYGGANFQYSPQISNLHDETQTLRESIDQGTVLYESLSDEHNQLFSEFNTLNENYDTLTDNYEQILSQYNSLSDEHNQLSTDFNTLNDNYDALSDNYDTLSNNYEEISSQYSEIQSEYEDLLEQYEQAVASLPLSPEPISAETIDMDYEWMFKGRRWTLSLSIPASLYDYYKEKDRATTTDYSVYITHPFDDEYINTVIMKFNFIALERGYSESEKINLVISFVQSLPYTSDSVTTPYDEYPRYPLETLVDNGGDCEDTSILTASLLKSMNYDVILIAPPEHMAVGVHVDTWGSYWEYNGRAYYFLETTSVGWEIGEIPDDYKETSAYLYELTPIPICTYNWTAEWKGEKLQIVFTVSNEGTAIASNIMVYIAFDAGEDGVWNPVESDPFDLNAGRSYTLTLLLDPPRDKHTRLVLGIVDVEAYQYIERSYSTWFDT